MLFLLITILVIGVILSLYALLRIAALKQYFPLDVILSVFLGPLMVYFSWKDLFQLKSKKAQKGNPEKKRVALTSSLIETAKLAKTNLHSSKPQMITSEYEALERNLEYANLNNLTKFDWYEDLSDSIKLLWDRDIHPCLYIDFRDSTHRLEKNKRYKDEEAPPKAADIFSSADSAKAEWFFGMTDEFVRSIRKTDRKMQGRILDAIKTICKEPMKVKGNTVKPLTGNLDGLWRYRIGRYRLVFQPNASARNILLLSFSSRDHAYH